MKMTAVPMSSGYASSRPAAEPWKAGVAVLAARQVLADLYTLRPEASPLPFEPLRTEDADVAAPARLARGKQTIAECLTRAGFQEHLSSDHTPPISE